VSEILDDMDSRPGSTTSLLRTIVGIYVRELGGWVSVADLLELMDALGVPDPRTRTAIVRVKKKGLLVPETRDRVAGYRLVDEAVPMLARGDRRVYYPRSMSADSAWCLVSFSIPEENRHLRHQLRRRLHWIGCGTVSPALWICPAYLLEEVEEILAELEVREHATVFVTERPRVAGPLAEAVAQWWDLDEIRSHRAVPHRARPRRRAGDGCCHQPPGGVLDLHPQHRHMAHRALHRSRSARGSTPTGLAGRRQQRPVAYPACTLQRPRDRLRLAGHGYAHRQSRT
jgi:hypothetical protein